MTSGKGGDGGGKETDVKRERENHQRWAVAKVESVGCGKTERFSNSGLKPEAEGERGSSLSFRRQNNRAAARESDILWHLGCFGRNAQKQTAAALRENRAAK